MKSCTTAGQDLPLTLELADVPRLADSWVEELRERAERLRAQAF